MKNSGTEIAASETTLTTRSIHLPSLMAATMPRPTASGTAISAAYPARNRVFSNFGVIEVRMSRLLVSATPKSPRMA